MYAVTFTELDNELFITDSNANGTALDWTKARCVAALDNRLPDAVTVRVEFKKPVFLPGSVALGSRIGDRDVAFSLTRPKDGAPHLVGRAVPA